MFNMQLQSMQQWKTSVEQRLADIAQAASLNQTSSPGLCKAATPVASSTTKPPSTDVSFPDSGFQSTSNQQATQEDSFLSSGTDDSLKTVRALSPAPSGFDGVDSADCSLLAQYLSSVQQRAEEAEEVEEVLSDRTAEPEPSSPVSPGKTAQSPSSQQREAEVQRTEGTSV